MGDARLPLKFSKGNTPGKKRLGRARKTACRRSDSRPVWGWKSLQQGVFLIPIMRFSASLHTNVGVIYPIAYSHTVASRRLRVSDYIVAYDFSHLSYRCMQAWIALVTEGHIPKKTIYMPLALWHINSCKACAELTRWSDIASDQKDCMQKIRLPAHCSKFHSRVKLLHIFNRDGNCGRNIRRRSGVNVVYVM